MLVGGPQVGSVAVGFEQGTARVDVGSRGDRAGGAGVGRSRQEGGDSRFAEDDDGPSRPEPD